MRAKICVYCGAAIPRDLQLVSLAAACGRLLGQHGFDIVYGGSHVGLMGAVADAALAAGAAVTGIIPHHLRAREVQHTGLTSLLVVDSMHARKHRMAEESDGFLILPGGFGTLDEMFEILTWKQLGLHEKPILLLNHAGFWDPLLQMIDRQIDAGFVRAALRSAFSVVRRPEEAVSCLREALPPHT